MMMSVSYIFVIVLVAFVVEPAVEAFVSKSVSHLTIRSLDLNHHSSPKPQRLYASTKIDDVPPQDSIKHGDKQGDEKFLDGIPALAADRSAPKNAHVLSHDPLVYTVPNLLSAEECQSIIDRARQLEESGEREMKQSNPPQVSLNIQKLWPLPFLSIGAGIPPILRYSEIHQTIDGGSSGGSLIVLPPTVGEIFGLIFPPIGIAFGISILLAFGIVLPLIQKVSESSSRTSTAMAWNLEQDIPYVKELVAKVSSITQNHPWESWEAPVFTRYSPGAIFAKHSDASPTRGSEWKNDGGQRVVTCIVYLNTISDTEKDAAAAASGGETYFDQLGFAVSPKQGHALVFYPTYGKSSSASSSSTTLKKKKNNNKMNQGNYHPLDADERLTHESLPVDVSSSNTDIEKCIIQMFGRVGPRVPPPLGLPDSFDTKTQTGTGTTSATTTN